MPATTAVYSPEAQQDLRKLFAWIARESGTDRARAVLFRLDRATSSLVRRPKIGRRLKEYQGEPYGFSVPPWLIIYEPLPRDPGIYVLRILDSRRDIAALLGKKP